MKQSYEEKVAAVRERFIHSADERVTIIAQLANKAIEGNRSVLSDLHMLLHDMGGNAMMLSFETIGSIARKGQELVSGIEKSGQVGDLIGLSGILEELSNAIVREREELDVDGSDAGSDDSSGSCANDR